MCTKHKTHLVKKNTFSDPMTTRFCVLSFVKIPQSWRLLSSRGRKIYQKKGQKKDGQTEKRSDKV